MTRAEIKAKYDEFFGTGLWERDYKSHIVIFAEQCLMTQEKGQNLPIHNVMPSLFKQRRQKLNLSMQDVTNKTDISKATISRIERGNDAFYDTVMKLDKFYSDNGA